MTLIIKTKRKKSKKNYIRKEVIKTPTDKCSDYSLSGPMLRAWHGLLPMSLETIQWCRYYHDPYLTGKGPGLEREIAQNHISGN